MANVNMTDLTQETLSTLNGEEQFVMFNSTEAKRATLEVIKKYIAAYILPNVASDYDSSSSYSIGDYVIKDGVFYICTTATTGTWDSEDWTAIEIGEVLTDVNDKIDNYLTFTDANSDGNIVVAFGNVTEE